MIDFICTMNRKIMFWFIYGLIIGAGAMRIGIMVEQGTLLAEREPEAWYKFIGFHLILVIISGAVLWFLL